MRITNRAGIVAFALLAATSSFKLMDASTTAETTTTLNPVADAFVDATKPARNFGTNDVLRADTRPVKRAFLRFSVGVEGSITSATLRLFGREADDGLRIAPVVSQSWGEKGITYNNAPSHGSAIASSPGAGADTWRSFDVTSRVQAGGLVSFAVLANDPSGAALGSRESGRPPQLIVVHESSPSASPTTFSSASPLPSPSDTPPSRDPVIAAAGDIACAPGSTVTPSECRHLATSNLVERMSTDAVLTLGDHQYEDGTLSEFMGAYDPTWGQFKEKTYPTAGNHEYHVAGAPGYFDYFGTRAGPVGKGYYSFDLGDWHIVSLNYYVSIGSSSEQITWLKQDLAADTNRCTLAFMHRARFSSGPHGSSTGPVPAWTALHADGAEVMLVGHDHTYERFAPQSPSGVAEPTGIRQFVVGTGGAELYDFGSVAPNSAFRYNATAGVLFMTLRPTGYDWEYRSETGEVIDSGTGTCT